MVILRKKIKTRKIKHQLKRKSTRRKINKKRGGNTSFEEKRALLIGNLQNYLDNLQERINGGEDLDEEDVSEEINSYMNEADEIDTHFGNHEMEDLINDTLDQAMEILNMIQTNNMNEIMNILSINGNNQNNNQNNSNTIINNNNNNKQ
jgi:hypothetical protein